MSTDLLPLTLNNHKEKRRHFNNIEHEQNILEQNLQILQIFSILLFGTYLRSYFDPFSWHPLLHPVIYTVSQRAIVFHISTPGWPEIRNTSTSLSQPCENRNIYCIHLIQFSRQKSNIKYADLVHCNIVFYEDKIFNIILTSWVILNPKSSPTTTCQLHPNFLSSSLYK